MRLVLQPVFVTLAVCRHIGNYLSYHTSDPRQR